MKVKPNENYCMLGTDVRLDKNRIYDAETATNQPDYDEKGKIFVLLPERGDDGFMLKSGEYTVIAE